MFLVTLNALVYYLNRSFCVCYLLLLLTFSHRLEGLGAAGLQEYIEFGNTTVLFNLTEWITSYKTTFVGDLEGDALAGRMRQLEDRRVAQQQLLTKADALLQEYLDAVAARIALCCNEPDVRMPVVVAALDTLLAGLAAMGTQLPQIGVNERGIETCVKIVRQVCSCVLWIYFCIYSRFFNRF